MAEDYPLKRRFPRISTKHAVLVKTVGDRPQEAFAKTRDVGLGGCGFVHREAVGVGATVELLISVKLRVVRAIGRVVYEVPRGDGSFEVGVEFVEISGRDSHVLKSLLADVGGA